MILSELFEPRPQEMQDLSQDGTQLSWEDVRKTKLTLGQINRLRKMNDMRSLEHQQEMSFVRKMYAPPTPAPGLGI